MISISEKKLSEEKVEHTVKIKTPDEDKAVRYYEQKHLNYHCFFLGIGQILNFLDSNYLFFSNRSNFKK